MVTATKLSGMFEDSLKVKIACDELSKQIHAFRFVRSEGFKYLCCSRGHHYLTEVLVIENVLLKGVK